LETSRNGAPEAATITEEQHSEEVIIGKTKTRHRDLWKNTGIKEQHSEEVIIGKTKTLSTHDVWNNTDIESAAFRVCHYMARQHS